MEDNIALLTSGFVLMRCIELSVLGYFSYRILRRGPRPVSAVAHYGSAHERARAAHSDKD